MFLNRLAKRTSKYMKWYDHSVQEAVKDAFKDIEHDTNINAYVSIGRDGLYVALGSDDCDIGEQNVPWSKLFSEVCETDTPASAGRIAEQLARLSRLYLKRKLFLEAK